MRFRIGCVPDLRLGRLQSLIGLLYADDPALAIEVMHLRSAEQLGRLRAGELDLGVVHDAGDGRAIDAAPVFAGEELAALLPIGHRLAGEPVLSARDLDGQVLLVSPRAVDPGLHDRLLRAIEQDGHRFGEIREIGGADIRDPLFAAAGSDGIALAPLSVSGIQSGGVSGRSTNSAASSPTRVIAWSPDPPAEFHATLTAARRIARDLFRYGRSLGT
jgi:hypothetical protein